jgi:hypothetical protein
MWTAKRILKELVDADKRRAILTAFWKHADTHARLAAQMHLAKALHFRDETIRKMPPEKKADLLASRVGVPEFEQFIENALMQHHTHEKNAMMGAFLDRWNVPHQNGSIEADDYKAPTADEVRDAVNVLRAAYDENDIALYLATAGLLMGDDWREATWPVVDELQSR